ncbi:MAG: squalene/phytoene synthase family protein [Candidatus Kapabacteria bacterium]|nr:squalene/phytoene synthase family protein [Candidatus Kapabacteria bacterium]
METIDQIQLANYENVEPPKLERSNFLYSFKLLPKEERNAITSVYAFCSYIDDIVDGSPNINNKSVQKKLDRLSWWENEIEKIYATRTLSPILFPFQAAIYRFDIPKQYFLTLIDGVRTDLIRNRYETFDELKHYCYSVAGIVGLISIEIFGHRYEETKNYAVNLGYALQMTNILRDVKHDKDRGYIYLPQEDLDRFGITESDIFEERYNDNFIEMMRFQTGRAREYFHKARTFLRPDEKPTIIAAEIMDSIYYRLLEKIELSEYDVFRRRIRVSALHKFMITMKHWLSVKMLINRTNK